MFARHIRRYILLLCLIIFTAVELPIMMIGLTTTPAVSDVIIVLGAKLIGNNPSTMLRLRLEEAVRLHQGGYAPMIIVSGARGADENMSEASAMRDYLMGHGIDSQSIIIEDQSYSTYQNLANCRSLMQNHGFNSAIIVSNTSHMRRALKLAHDLGIKASGSAAPMANNPYLTTKQYLREGAAMLSLLVIPAH